MFFILFYSLLLLYDCSGFSGFSGYSGYSGYFNSNNFNSNNFNSGKLHYSSHMLTMIPSSYSQMVSLNTIFSISSSPLA